MNKSALLASAAAFAALMGASGASAQEGDEVELTARDVCDLGAEQIAATEDLSVVGALTTGSARIDREQSEALNAVIVACSGDSSTLDGEVSWSIAVIEGAPVLFDVRDGGAVYYNLAALQAEDAQGAQRQVSTQEVCEAGAASIEDSIVEELAQIGALRTEVFEIDRRESNRFGVPVAVCEGDRLDARGGSLIWRVAIVGTSLRLVYVGDVGGSYYHVEPEALE